MSDIEALANDALVDMAKSAVLKAMADVHENQLFDKMWDKSVEDELAACISTLARLKVLESCILMTGIAAGVVDKDTAKKLKDVVSAAVLVQLLDNKAHTPQEVAEIYPEVDLRAATIKREPEDINLAKAASELKESLIQVAKTRQG